MSILIKGMKMPTRCDDCVMGHELNVGTSVTGYGCLAMLRMGDARIRPISCGTKPDWCPLVEIPTPHGRLIDADALKAKMVECSKHVDRNGFEWDLCAEVITMATLAPEIIEAEDEHDIS